MQNKIIILIFIITFSWVNSQTNGSFYPTPGSKYIVSGWVREIHAQQVVSYSSGIEIEFTTDNGNSLNTPIVFQPKGAVIEGWQRIVGILEIPLNYENNNINIRLTCQGNQECYFDDIRFYPYNGTMKSFVYDEGSKKLLAELDENNYATYYEYDNEGGLVRVKKETERGVYTIQESRSSTVKNVGP